MRKFYQREWQGIDFNLFAELSDREIAGGDFYNSFYQQLFQKYPGYESLPADWRLDKEKIVTLLLGLTTGKKHILSIGCGLGYVEHQLAREFAEKNKLLTAVEPSATASAWVREEPGVSLYHGYFPQCLGDGNSFDFAYASCIEYTFDTDQYCKFLKDIIAYGIKDFTMISASYETDTLKEKTAYLLYEACRISGVTLLLGKLGITKKKQLWGYLRNFDDHLAVFRDAGFDTIEHGMYEKTIPWVRGLVSE